MFRHCVIALDLLRTVAFSTLTMLLLSVGTGNALAGIRYAVTDMGALPGYNSFSPSAINASGQVVGNAQIAGFPTTKAFYYDGSPMVALPATSASGINASGQIACSGGLYSGGKMTSLGPVDQGGGLCVPAGINDYGDVVGQVRMRNGDYHACLYTNGSAGDMGTLGGTWSDAYAINNNGQIVGRADLANAPHTLLFIALAV